MSGVTEGTVKRLAIIGLVVVMMIGTLVARLWYLQVLEGDAMAHESTVNHVRILTKQAPRGRLLDRKGLVIAANEPSLVVGIRREEFRALPTRTQRDVENRLGDLLGMTRAEIEARLKDPRPSPYSPIPIAHGVRADLVEIISERQSDFPDVEWSAEPVRRYPHGSLAAQTIGFVNEVTAKELKRHPELYRLGDTIGRTGLEREYDRYIRGTNGYTKKEVDASGAVRRVLSEREYTPGNDLVLTIDAEVQKIAEQSLAQAAAAARGRVHLETKKRFPAPAGAAVVLDANTGGVVALASYPTFDVTKFVSDYPRNQFNDYYSSLLNPKAHQPLLNRAIGEAGTSYPPGSTFKPITAIAALSTGLASTGGRYHCTSEFKFGTGVFHNWRPENSSISLAQSLVESCDTVFYKFAQQWWLKEDPVAKAGKTPYEPLADYSRRFGLGQATGIDLQGETKGRVPDRVYKRDAWNANKKTYCENYQKTKEALWSDLCLRGFYWDGGDSVITSIGQGDVLVTPLQMAVVYGALANGGKVLQPHLVDSIRRQDGKTVKKFKPVVRSQVKASKGMLAYVAHALAGVTTKGTAAPVFAGWPLDRIPVAAKTGTAQITGQQPYSWFASFAPANGHPKYVVVAVVEKAGFGAQVAGPVCRRIMDALFDRPLTRIAYGQRSD